ncbi:glycosyltransferase family 9 protein [Candidatus Pelagibacter sp.]|uniref:glycosyltransferase family 9 protein n=1 Tax=Candidatus Pelagibacter sp. TaxID=2024849 RepID=UPI003F836482
MKILAIQNKMGIGDTVIFLPFIKAISNKFGAPVSLLVKENSKADEFLNQTNYIDEIIHLERDNKINQKHDGFKGFFKLASDIKKYNFNKVFIFNSSLRYNLISRLAGIKEIFQYPLFEKQNQHITEPAKVLIKKYLDCETGDNPEIQIDNDLVQKSAVNFNINNDELNVLLGVGGSGPTKRIPSKTFLNVMEKLETFKKCRFFLATGRSYDEQKILTEIYNTKFKEKCVTLDNLNIKEILPIIKNCNVAICNDTSFSHLSSALGVKTITLMADTPLIYGSYSSNMYPVIPDGEKTVSHNTLGKDKINPDKIYEKLISIIN